MWFPGLAIHKFLNSDGITLVNLGTVGTVASVSPYMEKKWSIGIDRHIFWHNSRSLLKWAMTDSN